MLEENSKVSIHEKMRNLSEVLMNFSDKDFDDSIKAQRMKKIRTILLSKILIH